MSELSFRQGRASDLETAYQLGETAWDESRHARGLIPQHQKRSHADLQEAWPRDKPLVEFLTAQQGGSFVVCEEGDEMVGFVLVSHFPEMDELTELWVASSHSGRGVRRGLLERCWPSSPTPELGRIVVAIGTPEDLTLFTDFGVMPVSGHWQMRHRLDSYLEQRAHEVDSTEPDVHVLTPDRAMEEWRRLEPEVIGHDRTSLQDFFSRTRNCLATVDTQSGRATAVCWVDANGAIGPAVGEHPEDLIPVVLAGLDRVAKMQEPETLRVFCTTASWWLMDRLRRLGFRVHWGGWIMSSVPLPGLDRYLPTDPVRVL